MLSGYWSGMKTLSRVWRPRFDASMLRQSGIRLASRPKQTRRRAVSLRLAARALIAPVAVVCLPAIVVFVLASYPSGPDLFHLIPLTSHSDRYLILEWANLRRAHNALIVDAIPSGTMIRALGYMMDGDRPGRDGERVRSFVLLPEAGDALHPADRFGDEMVNVELQAGNEVSFSGRSLVWVWGTLRALPGDPSGHQALYALENARAEPADKRDISKYFR